MLPLFFAAGRHLLHDVPARITALESQFDGLTVELLEPAGHHDAFWQALGRMIARQHAGQWDQRAGGGENDYGR